MIGKLGSFCRAWMKGASVILWRCLVSERMKTVALLVEEIQWIGVPTIFTFPIVLAVNFSCIVDSLLVQGRGKGTNGVFFEVVDSYGNVVVTLHRVAEDIKT